MLNQRIRLLRQARGLSQVELAKRLGVTKQSVSNWENDNIQPSIEMLKQLAQVFSPGAGTHRRTGYQRPVPGSCGTSASAGGRSSGCPLLNETPGFPPKAGERVENCRGLSPLPQGPEKNGNFPLAIRQRSCYNRLKILAL